MPQPADVAARAQRLIDLFASAQASLDEQVAAIATDPRSATARRRLKELRAGIDRQMAQLQAETASWLTGNLPPIYELGAGPTQTGVGDFTWTQIHVDAVQHLAEQTYSEVLQATEYVSADVKAWVRDQARQRTTATLLEGKTARQAARDLAKQGARDRVGTITYRNGSVHTLEDHADMLVRTTSANSYNAGTLNQLQEFGVGFAEALDGNGCGLTAHNDGSTANGMVVDLATARLHPLAHPRCRRSWVGRPDITDAKQAAAQEPRTTPVAGEQPTITPAQAKAFADRQAASQQAPAGRQPRTARAAREPRTARTPRASV